MPRLDLPTEAEMTPEQADACVRFKAGPRGAVPTPVIAWIRNPELARRAQGLGALLRSGTVLEPRLAELAILVCARHWTSHREWTMHKRAALKAGLEPEVIAAIAARRRPGLADEKGRTVHEISAALLASGHLPEALYRDGVAALGERGMVELVALVGYYCFVALTLNAFELGMPESHAPELGE
jgi:4-carboxymuconolactone decarboxylase